MQDCIVALVQIPKGLTFNMNNTSLFFLHTQIAKFTTDSTIRTSKCKVTEFIQNNKVIKLMMKMKFGYAQRNIGNTNLIFTAMEPALLYYVLLCHISLLHIFAGWIYQDLVHLLCPVGRCTKKIVHRMYAKFFKKG